MKYGSNKFATLFEGNNLSHSKHENLLQSFKW
jgi:hypothetical protein